MSHWCHCQVNVMASLKWQESLMAVASCSTVSMSDLRYCCFIRPKPPSTKHLVWPTRMNSKLMSLFRPTTFRQERYAVTVRFLFWPQQLSACSPKYGAPSELFFSDGNGAWRRRCSGRVPCCRVFRSIDAHQRCS